MRIYAIFSERQQGSHCLNDCGLTKNYIFIEPCFLIYESRAAYLGMYFHKIRIPMKPFFVFLMCFLPITHHAQNKSIDNIVDELTLKIEKNKGADRLRWMDSLSNYIAYDTNFEKDSIVRATIEYAKALDSIDIAVWHGANIIFYYNAIKGNPEAAKRFILENKPIVKKATKLNVLSKYFLESGTTYFYLNEYEKSLHKYDTAYMYAKRNQNKKFMGLSKMSQGHVYTDMGNFGQASIVLQEGLKTFQLTKDTTSIVGTRNSLSILYSKNGFYNEAKEERDAIIIIEEKRKNYDNLPAIHFNAAADDNKIGQQSQRIINLKRALAAAKRSRYEDYYNPIILNTLVSAYAENDSIEKAEAYLTIVNKNEEKNTTGPYKEFNLDALKNLAYTKKEYEKALRLGKEYLLIKKQGKQYEEIQEAENFLYNTQKSLGNTSEALRHYENYRKIKDSIESAQKVRVLSYYQTIYETEKRDLKIQAQKSDIALLDAKNKVQNQWLLFGGLGLVSVFGFFWVVRSRNYAKRKQRAQENFTKDILKTQENERARIAGELHDSIGQKLLMIKNSFANKQPENAEEITLVGETIREVREMSHNLHPFQFEKLGLIQSLKNMIETFQKNSNVFYSEDINMEESNLQKEKEIYVFRMLQECLTNVEKHANATACNLSVTENRKELIFQLKDNGNGFKVSDNNNSADGLGMRTLRERAHFIGASLTIDSYPDKGTTCSIKVPKL